MAVKHGVVPLTPLTFQINLRNINVFGVGFEIVAEVKADPAVGSGDPVDLRVSVGGSCSAPYSDIIIIVVVLKERLDDSLCLGFGSVCRAGDVFNGPSLVDGEVGKKLVNGFVGNGDVVDVDLHTVHLRRDLQSAESRIGEVALVCQAVGAEIYDRLLPRHSVGDRHEGQPPCAGGEERPVVKPNAVGIRNIEPAVVNGNKRAVFKLLQLDVNVTFGVKDAVMTDGAQIVKEILVSGGNGDIDRLGHAARDDRKIVFV